MEPIDLATVTEQESEWEHLVLQIQEYELVADDADLINIGNIENSLAQFFFQNSFVEIFSLLVAVALVVQHLRMKMVHYESMKMTDSES